MLIYLHEKGYIKEYTKLATMHVAEGNQSKNYAGEHIAKYIKLVILKCNIILYIIGIHL